MKCEVKWIGGTAFRADTPSGVSFVMACDEKHCGVVATPRSATKVIIKH